VAQVEAPLIEPAIVERALARAWGAGVSSLRSSSRTVAPLGVARQSEGRRGLLRPRSRGRNPRCLGTRRGSPHCGSKRVGPTRGARPPLRSHGVVTWRARGIFEGRSSLASSVEIYPIRSARQQRWSYCIRADEAARASGAAIVQVSAGYGDSRRRIWSRNSDGLLSSDDRFGRDSRSLCVASGDTGMQTGYETAAFTIGFELFDKVSVEETAQIAAHRPSRSSPRVPRRRGCCLFDQEWHRWNPLP